ncbi:MAG: glutamyl-tRNA reductase [Syntrophomonadaceae bacterium]|nr:glutamyl-tRNA reductase [Syntrophomonadaceae bacterium]
MYVLLAGLNHRTAPVEVREKLAIAEPELNRAYQCLTAKGEIEGAVILTTCNRTEIYATTRSIEKGQKMLLEFLQEYAGFDDAWLSQYIYQSNCQEAILHLFRVVSGLDSMILGETEILGQVKDAYLYAMEAKVSDSVLNTLFQKAIYVGKKVRTETEIDKHSLSVGHAAVQLAENAFGSLKDKTVLVIGAGKMGEISARCLMANGVKTVIVSNRSFDKAVDMAQDLNGRAVRFDRLADELTAADIVISCTGASHYVVRTDRAREILKLRQGKPILMIDIAVPRDIDPALQEIAGVQILDIDDLQGVVDANYEQRLKASAAAEEIIKQELELFNEWLASLCVVPVITALKNHSEMITNNELKKAFNRLGEVSEQEEKIINSMAHAIVKQLLHSPIINLKQMATCSDGHFYAEMVKNLFALEVNIEETAEYENIKIGNQGQ